MRSALIRLTTASAAIAATATLLLLPKLLGALLVFVNLAPNTWQIHIKPRVWYGTATGIGAALAVMTISQPHPFIYFQF